MALSSVSRVLTAHPDVSASMRQRVEAAVRELGYEPDLLAQSMRSGSTHTVGFVLRDISNPLFASIARRCEQELRRVNYSMLLTDSDGDVDAEVANLNLLRRRRVDGVIASLESETSAATNQALAGLQVPVVLLDREVPSLDAGAVLVDHCPGVRSATTELIMKGHRRISLITGGLDVRSSRERLRGYREAFTEYDLAVDDDLMSFGRFDPEYARLEAVRLLSRLSRPTAFLTGGVGTTAGVLRALRQLGLVPGTDIALVALDEWPLFDVSTPSLASVSRDPDEIGSTAARLLLDMLTGGRPQQLTIATRFSPRQSITTLTRPTRRKKTPTRT